MRGYKTFIIAVAILAGTLLVMTTTPDLEAASKIELWKWAVISVGSMVGIREFADKFKKP